MTQTLEKFSQPLLETSVIYNRRTFYMQAYARKQQNPKTTEFSGSLLKEIGLLLREAREKKLFTVKDIREKTCIPIHYILAIESGIREQLPEDLYLIGFIRRYARAVGLNEEKLCSKYSTEKKIKDCNHESDAFDLLFEEKSEQNTMTYRRTPLLRVYHFYFLIGIILFLTACYFVARYDNVNQTNHSNINDKFVKEEKAENISSVVFEGGGVKGKSPEVVIHQVDVPKIVRSSEHKISRSEDHKILKPKALSKAIAKKSPTDSLQESKKNIQPVKVPVETKQSIKTQEVKKIETVPTIMLRPPVQVKN